MTEITPLQNTTSGYLSANTINDNNDKVETAVKNSLGRVAPTDGTSNAMQTTIDMNSNRVINLGTAVNDTDAVTKKYVDDNIGDAYTYSLNAAASAAAALVSENNAASSETQTGLDAIATAADRIQTGLDVIATAADRVQTGLDVIATGADRVQTGLDVATTNQNVIDAQAAQTAAENARDDILTDAGFIAVSADLTNINTVATNVINVNSVAGSITNVNNVAGDLTNINNVAADLTNINSVATDLTNVNTVATDIANVNTCATNIAAIIAAPTEAANAAVSASEAASYAAQAQSSASTGAGVVVFLDDTVTIDGYGGLLRSPNTAIAEVQDSVVANNNTVFIEGYLYNQAQNRTKWHGGVWKFNTWASVSSTSAGTSEVITCVYHVINSIGTVTVTGSGTSRTATVTGATPFVAGDANADQTLSGYVQTANGTFQITGYTSSSVVTIATPSGYSNESNASYSLHHYGFQASTGALTSTTLTRYQAVVAQSDSVAHALVDTIAFRYYGKTTATKNRTITITHNGTTRYSFVESPLPERHDELDGLNLTGTNYHHLSTTEYNNVVGAQTNGYSFRNKIIGGNFATNRWTKGTSVAVASTVASTSTPDNWVVSNQTDGAITVSRINGFADQGNGRYSSYACKINVDTADTSIAAGQYAAFIQNIEASSLSGIGFGVGGTRYINISYLLKSNITGTMCMFFTNAATDRCYIKEVSVTGSDTVQLVNFSIPVDTTGTWNILEGTCGLRVGFTLATGSTFQTTANSWTAGNYLGSSNQTNFLATQNNYIALDLVQLEFGNAATPFEYRDYATEERLQDRYFPVIKSTSTVNYAGRGLATATNTGLFMYDFKTRPYAAPTGIVASNAAHLTFNDGVTATASTSIAYTASSKEQATLAIGFSGGLTQYRGYITYINNASGYIYFTGAEVV